MDLLSYLLGKKAGGGGGEAVLINKSVTANGTYNASSDNADGYKKVEVSVPNSYSAGDEGKVVDGGALVAQGSATYTANGTYDTTLISEVEVDVPAAADPAFAALLEGTLTTLDNSDATSIRAKGLIGLTSLTTVNLPNVTTVNNDSLNGCTGITSLSLPNLISANGNACFRYLTSLQAVALPKLKNISNSVFGDCTALSAADLGPDLTGIGAYMFERNTNLKTLILRRAAVVTLGSTNSFNNSPFASGGSGGTLYVPSSMISSYQGATNWGTILGYANNQIKAIEGSIYETQYADGTPIS